MTVAFATPPPLRDGEVTLEAVDERTPALLVAASHDADIVRWTQVPASLSMVDAGLVAAAWAGSSASVRLQVCIPWLAPAGMVTAWSNAEDQVEVGYWLLEPARGRGFARRALLMLCEWLFAACAVPQLQLTTLPGNLASERVASACGFAVAGEVMRDVRGSRCPLRLWERERSSAPALTSPRRPP